MRFRNISVFLCIFLIIIASVLVFKFSHRLLQRRRLPRIALVIDDWGYNLNNVDFLRTIDIPITLAILPNLKHSKEIAKEAGFRNREIILHMPMEPRNPFLRLEQDTLLTTMNKKRISSVFHKALSSVPGAKGVSNHMGSRFTAHPETMDIFLSQLRRKRLFFLDNMACEDSVCCGIASKRKVKFIRRDVFLDNRNNIDYIKKQFQQLVETARVRGYAVGTGHDRSKTLKVIKESVPDLKNKIRFIFVSKLAK